MDQKKTGSFIAQRRREKGMTQEQLAEKLGVTNKSVSRWENGRNMPDYSVLTELCSELEMSVDALLAGEKLEDSDLHSRTSENLDMILKEYYRKKGLLSQSVISVAGV